jgi:hypothetical protein
MEEQRLISKYGGLWGSKNKNIRRLIYLYFIQKLVFSSVWVWNLVSDIKGGTEGV